MYVFVELHLRNTCCQHYSLNHGRSVTMYFKLLVGSTVLLLAAMIIALWALTDNLLFSVTIGTIISAGGMSLIWKTVPSNGVK